MPPADVRTTRGSRFAVFLARTRMPLLWGSAAFLVAGVVLDVPPWLPIAILVLALAVYLRIGTVRGEPVEVRVPVSGRWLAVNSPADRVPSHLMHAYGQTYAVDLVYVPSDDHRPSLHWWPLTRGPEVFPGFGQAVLAPADATIVRVRDGQRDHASRTSWPAVVAMFALESPLREVSGPRRILGNHVVLDLGDGAYAVAAHLRCDSVRVRRGQRVEAGAQIAECGNSGNSTEPHVHFQVMDHPNVLLAAGLPVSFTYEVDGEHRTGVPGRAHAFRVPDASTHEGAGRTRA
jgi:murein DD-endopeptidase MepM/ murein hydrolase activator NlpD